MFSYSIPLLILAGLCVSAPGAVQRNTQSRPAHPLAGWAGTFDRVVRFQWQGKWRTERGHTVRTLIFGGRFLREEWFNAKGRSDGVRYFGYDRGSRQFQLVTMDRLTPLASVAKGTRTGNQLILTGREKFPWSKKPQTVQICFHTPPGKLPSETLWTGTGKARREIMRVSLAGR